MWVYCAVQVGRGRTKIVNQYVRIDERAMKHLLYLYMEFNNSKYLCIVSSILGEVILLDIYYLCVLLAIYDANEILLRNTTYTLLRDSSFE
jgi:hypothetical protein